MATAQAFDFVKASEKFIDAFNVDTKTFDDAVKTTVELNANLGKVMIDAARKNAELASGWTQDVLGRMDEANRACGTPAEYAAAASEFATAETQAMPKRLAQFAEVAKTAQLDAIDLFIGASESVQAQAAKAAAPAPAKAKPAK
ncbi:MAG: phasin, PhaP [Paracoccaceae bacterium]|nr:phasin, PhaP [Paracoccaceae bacterium]MDE2912058.1 phasin, PhaP [Paracoccaceae bacterium]